MVDLAVGVSVGGAFSELVRSLVQNVVTPPIRMTLATARSAANDAAGGGANAVGFDRNAAPTGVTAFASQLGSFLLLALVIFAAVKLSNGIKRRFAARPRRRSQGRSAPIAGRFADAPGRPERTHHLIIGTDGGCNAEEIRNGVSY